MHHTHNSLFQQDSLILLDQWDECGIVGIIHREQVDVLYSVTAVVFIYMFRAPVAVSFTKETT